MAVIIGTSGADTLVGTDEADILQPFSTDTRDVLRGLNGADTYDLRRDQNLSKYDFLIDDGGTDGAVNTITNVGALYYSASFGYSGYATAIRIGDDLIVHTPSKPHRFRSPAKPSYDIEIKDQYGDGQISSIQAGSVVYNLSPGSIGTALEDLMAGSNQADVLSSGDGNDWLFGNGGRDVLQAGAGDDTVFGGRGADDIQATSGNNLIFAENGNDRVTTGDGADRIQGGQGKDKINAGGGNDIVDGGTGNDVLRGKDGDDALTGGDGNDRLVGGKGRDILDAGSGDNLLVGGKGGDTYVISTDFSGSNTIIDKGDTPHPAIYATGADDVIRITDFDSFDAGFHALDVQVSGEDLILSYMNSDALQGQITIENHFLGDRFAIERIGLNTVSTVTDFHISKLSGDDYTFSVHNGPDAGGNDIILGTEGNDELYGGIGNNIYVAGAGADIFIFKDQEDNRGGIDLIKDFDLSEDVLDFTEIETLTRSGLTYADNSYGNVVISSPEETIELQGITAAEISDAIFVFA